MSPLHEASRDGDTERVQELLEVGDAPVNENEEDGMWAPLIWTPHVPR